MSDTIIFMSAYDTTKYSKSRLPHLGKKQSLAMSFDKYHLTYILLGDKLISSKGTLELCTEYDHVQQKTVFSFNLIKDKNKIEEFEEIISDTGFCIKLLHAQSVLADPRYFSIDYFICMKHFLVNINKRVLQIDPVIYSMNRTLMILFEIIDFETGQPLKKDDVLGKIGNYNLLTVEGYQYFEDEKMTPYKGKISELIYKNIVDFFFESIGKNFKAESYSFLHNTLVLSNDIDEVAQYLCDLIGIRKLPSPIENISTTENYEYYPQEGVGVIRNYNDIDISLFNGIIFESIKLYIFLFQIVNVDDIETLNDVVRNDMYVENLFFAPDIPIETYNFLGYIYKTESFQHWKKSAKLKISYMTAEIDAKKNRNSVVLNILLYIISILGAIDALETLENKLGIPFEYSFTIVVLTFLIVGIIWMFSELKYNKNF